MLERCPGSLRGAPTIKIKKCPECGSEVEVFSSDVKVNCDKCGFTVYNDVESCVQWCKYAKLCVGDDLYKKLKRTRVAFVGVDNAARSVLAEVLAKEINSSPRMGFLSAGTLPAEAVEGAAVEALNAENISWRGKPKNVARIGLADIYVLMGPEVNLPAELEKARVIRWEIPHPREAGYPEVIKLLREKIATLIMEVDEND